MINKRCDKGYSALELWFAEWEQIIPEDAREALRAIVNKHLYGNCSYWCPACYAEVAKPEPGKVSDVAWVQRIRETAAHLRDNSISLAKYPDMAKEARARELAALYIQEIADLYEAKRSIEAMAAPAPEGN